MDADEVMQEYGAAWGRGDPAGAFAFYADDVVMHLPGRSALAGEHRGKAAVVDAILALLARTDGLPVTVVLREVATRGDATLELRRVNVYRIRDGKITDIDIFEADQYEVDAFFGGE
jgi:ketosteroid isomerase-like protein